MTKAASAGGVRKVLEAAQTAELTVEVVAGEIGHSGTIIWIDAPGGHPDVGATDPVVVLQRPEGRVIVVVIAKITAIEFSPGDL